MPLTKVKYGMIDEDAIAQMQGGAKTVSDVIAAKDIGYLTAGETVPTATTFQHFVEMLLTTTFYPTTVEPTVDLTTGTIGLSVEAGSSLYNIVLNAAYTAGIVKGQFIGGVWLPNNVQSSAYTGAATKYTFSGGDIEGDRDNATTSTYTAYATEAWIGDSPITFNVSTNYAAGVYYPLDSAGGQYIAEGQASATHASGTVTDSLTITPFRKMFYQSRTGSLTAPVADQDASSFVRTNSTAFNSPANGTSRVINIAVGDTHVMFAYPASLEDVKSVIDSGTGYDIKSSFTKVVCPVDGNVTGKSATNYKIYYYKPAQAYSSAVTYTVTI